MTKIVFRQPDGSEKTVDVEDDTSVMQAAIGNGVDGIVAECGGSLQCATCHVYVEEGLDAMPAMEEMEDEMLECAASPRAPNSRLSCQLHPHGHCERIVVQVPDTQV